MDSSVYGPHMEIEHSSNFLSGVDAILIDADRGNDGIEDETQLVVDHGQQIDDLVWHLRKNSSHHSGAPDARRTYHLCFLDFFLLSLGVCRNFSGKCFST